jgi:hypothetical protein
MVLWARGQVGLSRVELQIAQHMGTTYFVYDNLLGTNTIHPGEQQTKRRHHYHCPEWTWNLQAILFLALRCVEISEDPDLGHLGSLVVFTFSLMPPRGDCSTLT